MLSQTPPKTARESRLSRLTRDTGGNYALIFALALPMLIPAVGIGWDTVRSMALKKDLQQSIDATAQTMTQRVNSCLATTRTASGAGGFNNDTDNGCLNNAQYTSNLKGSAQTLLTQNFSQHGYLNAPTIVGDVTINQITGQLNMQGSVSYRCVFMKLVYPSGCIVTAGSGTDLENAYAQGKVLQISVPTEVYDLWATYPNQPANPKPLIISATDGWKPYSWAAGTNLPTGLAINSIAADKAQIVGTPIDVACDTPNCLPQTMAPVAVSVMDSGDVNRANLNRQTSVGYAKFRMIHVLKITQMQGVVGEDGNRDSGNMRPNVFTYGAVPTVSGGLGPFTFTCSGMPQGLPNHPFTCDSATGTISGQPALSAARPSMSGTYQVTVTDSRGITATGSMNYNYVIPTFTAYGGTVTGTFGLNLPDNSYAFGADGGYGWVNASCTNLPVQIYCAGQGYDSGGSSGGYFRGLIQGQPKPGTAPDGTIYATLTDAAGRSQVVGIVYHWTQPTQDQIDYYDCGSSYTPVAYVDAVYSSVHDKWGSGQQQRIYWSCGASADPGGYTPNNYAVGGVKYGTNDPVQYENKQAMQALLNAAANVCQLMITQVITVSAGRQGNTCASAPVFADISQYGRVNSPPLAPAPQICFRWRSQDGWGQTQGQYISCTNQDGSGVTYASW